MPTPRKSRGAPATPMESGFGSHDHRILLLQGGGALGAYHAGVYEGLAAGGFAPDWVVGISIGAINSALIAGNAREHRLERLREFWDLVSARAPFVLPAGMDFARPMMNQMAAASAMMFGIPGFFTPRMPMPQFAVPGTIGALSYYDTEPLRATLERLVDFDRINAGEMRLSLGTANVRTGESVYFDNTTHKISASHVMASCALPPGFPPVEIDGEFYVDGGIMTNTPLAFVGKDFRMSALVVQVDLFSGLGEMPKTLNEVQERVKDIQFQSKARLSVDEVRAIESLRSKLASVIERLPARLRADPLVRELEEISQRGRVSLIHLVNRHDTASLDFKDSYLIASGKAGFSLSGGFPSNGYGEHSPGGYGLASALVTEVVMTMMFLIVILGATDKRAPAGFAPIAIGLCLTLIHLISIPVTNTSVNPARSTGVAVYVGGWAVEQLWLFWVAPIAGALIGAVVYRAIGADD